MKIVKTLKTLIISIIFLLASFTIVEAKEVGTIKEICKNGYSYIVATVYYNGNVGISIVQVFLSGNGDRQPPQPKTCNNG